MHLPDTPQDHDNRMYDVGFSDGREQGRQDVYDALCHEISDAVRRHAADGDRSTLDRLSGFASWLAGRYPEIKTQ